MSRTFPLLALTLGLTACGDDTGDKSDTTGDDTAGSVSGTNINVQVDWDTDNNLATYTIEADGPFYGAAFQAIYVGQPAYIAGCVEPIYSDDSEVCGAHVEYHNAFETVSTSNAMGGYTQVLTLRIVDFQDDADVQTNNQSTRIWWGNMTNVAAMWTVYDETLEPLTCQRQAGYNPDGELVDYFADRCGDGS
jgi:hypothetical protein